MQMIVDYDGPTGDEVAAPLLGSVLLMGMRQGVVVMVFGVSSRSFRK